MNSRFDLSEYLRLHLALGLGLTLEFSGRLHLNFPPCLMREHGYLGLNYWLHVSYVPDLTLFLRLTYYRGLTCF